MPTANERARYYSEMLEKKGKGKQKGIENENRSKKKIEKGKNNKDTNVVSNKNNDTSGDTGTTSSISLIHQEKTINISVNPFEENHLKYRDIDQLTAGNLVEDIVCSPLPVTIKTPLEVEGNLIVMIDDREGKCQLLFGIIEQSKFLEIWGMASIYYLKLAEKLAVWSAAGRIEEEYWICITVNYNWSPIKLSWVKPFKLKNYPRKEVNTLDIYGCYKGRGKLAWLDAIDESVRDLKLENFLDGKKEEIRQATIEVKVPVETN